MIKGIGIDLSENNRFESFVDNIRKIERILSPKEIEVYNNINNSLKKCEYLSSRFCTKEAFIKASNFSKLKFNYVDLSILNREDGSPYIETTFEFDYIIHVSISHIDSLSNCIVIIEEKENSKKN